MKKVLLTLALSEKRMTAINQHISAECISGIKNLYQEVEEKISSYEGLLLLGPIKKIDAPLLSKAKNLKIISNYGVGYDKIDVAFAKANGIIVANTPYAVTAPTADLALALMLSLCRRVNVSDRAIRNKKLGSWYNTQLPSISMTGKILGIIGMGRIGKAVAKRALAFGMKIIYYQRNRLSSTIEKAYQANYLPLNDLLQQADIISPHIPLTTNTHHLLGAKELSLLKSTAFLINTARGAVIDELALIELLQNKKIAGAALDVFEDEPSVPEVFLTMDNVILTPHIGTASSEARGAMFEEAIQNLVEFFSGREVMNRVV